MNYTVESLYLISSVLFVLGIRGLTHPESARRGVFFAELGMVFAVAGTLVNPEIVEYKWIIIAGVIRVLPLTGVTLPFVSYGGSSLLANWVLLAFLAVVIAYIVGGWVAGRRSASGPFLVKSPSSLCCYCWPRGLPSRQRSRVE